MEFEMTSNSPDPRPERHLRVLVVDNDRDGADSMAMLVRLWGHDALVAYGGADAIVADPNYLPDVMILDISMPVMDGNELARQVRHLVGREDVLLIAITGHGYETDVRLSMEAGFDHHLLKPVEPSVVAELLATARDRLRSAMTGVRPIRAMLPSHAVESVDE
jgi:CheY-like chemotaxis protein